MNVQWFRGSGRLVSERKCMKKPGKNEAAMEVGSGIDFSSIWARFGAGFGKQNRSKNDRKKHRKNDIEKTGSQRGQGCQKWSKWLLKYHPGTDDVTSLFPLFSALGAKLPKMDDVDPKMTHLGVDLGTFGRWIFVIWGWNSGGFSHWFLFDLETKRPTHTHTFGKMFWEL